MAITIDAAEWLVLDNVKNGWPYRSNLSWDMADKAYLRCVENEYIKNGRITPAGELALMTNPKPANPKECR